MLKLLEVDMNRNAQCMASNQLPHLGSERNNPARGLGLPATTSRGRGRAGLCPWRRLAKA